MASGFLNKVKKIGIGILTGVVIVATFFGCCQISEDLYHEIYEDDSAGIVETLNGRGDLFAYESVTYKTQRQIRDDAGLFHADLTAIDESKEFATLKNNGSEPIYVYIADDFSSGNKQMINTVVEYYNNIMSKINDNYSFKVVDKATYDDAVAKEKATISFGIKELESSGLANWELDNGGSGEYIITDAKIYLDNSFIDKSQEGSVHLQYTTAHEMAHILGIPDVYSYEINNNIVNSVTNVNNSYGSVSSSLLTPNDYKILFAKYFQGHLGKDYVEQFISAKLAVNEYERIYFSAIAKDYSVGHSHSVLEGDTNDFVFQVNTKNETRHYHFSVNKDKYKLTVKSSSGIVLDEVEGQCLLINNVLFLKSVKLKDSVLCDGTSIGFIGDLAIYNDTEGCSVLEIVNTNNIRHIALEEVSLKTKIDALKMSTTKKITSENISEYKNKMFMFADSQNTKAIFAIRNSVIMQRTTKGSKQLEFIFVDNYLLIKNFEYKTLVAGTTNSYETKSSPAVIYYNENDQLVINILDADIEVRLDNTMMSYNDRIFSTEPLENSEDVDFVD